MSKVIASLSDQGWVFDGPKTLNALLSYYILTDAGQSLVFQNNLINLPQTYYKYINDPQAMANAVKNDLDKLLGRYFQSVDVLTQAKATTDSKYAILIYATVVDENNTKINLARVTEIDSTGLRKILEVNNYGDAQSMLSSL